MPNRASNSRNLRLSGSPRRVSQSRTRAGFRPPDPSVREAPHSSHAGGRRSETGIRRAPSATVHPLARQHGCDDAGVCHGSGRVGQRCRGRARRGRHRLGAQASAPVLVEAQPRWLDREGAKCSIRRDRLFGAPRWALGVRAQDGGAQPGEWIELLDRGVRAVRQVERPTPTASGTGRRGLPVRAQMRSTRSLSLVGVGVLHRRCDSQLSRSGATSSGRNALGMLDPVALHRAREAAARRRRRARLGWPGRRSRAPPARSQRARPCRTSSARSSELVISTPDPSRRRAVREPSVPSMNALT